MKSPVASCLKIVIITCAFALALPAKVCAQESPAQGTAAPLTVFQAEYYGELGCSHCDDFLLKQLPEAERLAGIKADVSPFDILSASGYDRCEKELAARGISFTVFPVLITGNNVYRGNAAIEANLVPELEYFAKTGTYRPALSGRADGVDGVGDAEKRLTLAVIPVLVAGLVDGINPCAFATMLFFMSWIALRGGGRKRLAFTGGAFIFGVFATYFAIGFGLSAAIAVLPALGPVRNVLRVLFAFVALVFAVLSFADASKAFRGKAALMTLQLPDRIKRLIHRSIKSIPSGDGKPSFVSGIAVLAVGATVSILELACTGQVYFPTIAYMAQSSRSSAVPALWLLLYNLAFITPLGAVLAVCLAGTGQDKIRAAFSRNLGAAKIALGIFFAGLAILIWLN